MNKEVYWLELLLDLFVFKTHASIITGMEHGKYVAGARMYLVLKLSRLVSTLSTTISDRPSNFSCFHIHACQKTSTQGKA
jgi:hypothetical protein